MSDSLFASRPLLRGWFHVSRFPANEWVNWQRVGQLSGKRQSTASWSHVAVGGLRIRNTQGLVCRACVYSIVLRLSRQAS